MIHMARIGGRKNCSRKINVHIQWYKDKLMVKYTRRFRRWLLVFSWCRFSTIVRHRLKWQTSIVDGHSPFHTGQTIGNVYNDTFEKSNPATVHVIMKWIK